MNLLLAAGRIISACGLNRPRLARDSVLSGITIWRKLNIISLSAVRVILLVRCATEEVAYFKELGHLTRLFIFICPLPVKAGEQGLPVLPQNARML